MTFVLLLLLLLLVALLPSLLVVVVTSLPLLLLRSAILGSCLVSLRGQSAVSKRNAIRC